MRVGVVGGTGLYRWPRTAAVRVESPWGDVELGYADEGGRSIIFVARHGSRHEVPAHRIEFRAIVWALKRANSDYVLATNNCGSLRRDLAQGSLMVPDGLVDDGARFTFFDQDAVHVSMDPPYCPTAAHVLRSAAKARGGVYASTRGPRFETAAEAFRLAAAGADVVGMTGGPEASLAREAGLHYASLCYVANPALGMGKAVEAATVRRQFSQDLGRVRRVLRTAIKALPQSSGCGCAKASARGRLV